MYYQNSVFAFVLIILLLWLHCMTSCINFVLVFSSKKINFWSVPRPLPIVSHYQENWIGAPDHSKSHQRISGQGQGSDPWREDQSNTPCGSPILCSVHAPQNKVSVVFLTQGQLGWIFSHCRWLEKFWLQIVHIQTSRLCLAQVKKMVGFQFSQ